jgi:NTP pyrophosphatase (non-canonical NTP hydrolase)
MDMHAFSAVNRQRCEHPTGFNHRLDSWSLSDWMTATMGELGEAANIVKKLNRVRDGIPGNKVSPEELRSRLASELADTFIYLDLLAQAAGIRLEDAVKKVFNAKSEELGCKITCDELATSQKRIEKLEAENKRLRACLRESDLT